MPPIKTLKYVANGPWERVVLDPRFNWSFIKKDGSWDVDPETMSQRLAYTTRQALQDLDPTVDPNMEYHDSRYIEMHGPAITADSRKLWKLKLIDWWHKYRAEHFPGMANDFVPEEMTAESLFFSFDSDASTTPPPAPEAIDDSGLRLNEIPTEISRYFALSSIPIDSDPLLWWRANARKYPVLARMARDILAIPASSAEPERVHSGGRTVINWNQSRMGVESIEASVAVKCFLTYNRGHMVVNSDVESVPVE